MFNSLGYEPRFVQRQKIKDDTAHLYSHIYKFHSPVTKLNYVIIADYHNTDSDVFSLKFYAKRDKRLDNKYSININKGDVPNILITCIKVIHILLKENPTASFGVLGARTIEKKTALVENYSFNQRFRVYRKVVPRLIGTQTFEHFEYENVSAYLLINRKKGDITSQETIIKQMFCRTYPKLVDIL